MERRSNNKKLTYILTAVVVILICALCAAVFFFVKMKNSNTLYKEAQLAASQYNYSKAIDILKSDTGKSLIYNQTIEEYTQKMNELELNEPSQTPHIFFHSLICDTQLAFDGDEDAAGYNLYMTTIDEFKEILEQLYKNNYVLVSPHDLYVETENGFIPNEILLPAEKRPIVISQDDVNYYSYMKNDGFASRFVIDKGKVRCEYIDQDGTVSVGAYDVVPILDDFVEKHPDFSYHGAKAVIAVTGFEGAFGYHNVIDQNSPEYSEECDTVRKIAETLKSSGYDLASHTYGHIPCGTSEIETLRNDTKDWSEQIGSLIGGTDILIYPYGEDLTSDVYYDAYEDTPKFEILYNAGFRYYLNVDSSHDAWMQTGTRYFRGARRNIDGYRMSHNGDEMSDLFYDLSKIYDNRRPSVGDLN